jgi:uncharacterized protein with HEPN domain
MSDNLREDLLLILEHLDEVESFFEEINKPDDFVKTKQGKAYYNAIIMHLQAGGEVLKGAFQLHSTLFLKYNEVPWNEIIRLRDLISHHYDKLQHEVVFDICENSLPVLSKTIKKDIG